MTTTETKREVLTAEELQYQLIEEGRMQFEDVLVQGPVLIHDITTDEGTDLIFQNVTFSGSLSIIHSSISNNLVLDHIGVSGEVRINGVRVNNDLHIDVGATDLSIFGTQVGRDLNLANSKVGGKVDFRNSAVGAHILCGSNIGLALQCFLVFGSKVHLDTRACREVAERLLGR